MKTMQLEGLNLDAENPASDTIEVVYQKVPINVEPGAVANSKVEIDLEPSDEMRRLGAEAEALQALPELERLHAVLDLLRGSVDYPYTETVEQLREENAELATWIQDRLLPEGDGGTKKLSEVLDKGYGACGELSAAYLWLAQHAGLKGIIMRSHTDTPITNINRAGSDQPLFRETEPGGVTQVHAWTEILTESRGWVPVDPSTKYIGDTDERLQTFKDAGYMAHIMAHDNLVSVEPSETLHATATILPVAPGHETVTAQINARLHLPKIQMDSDLDGTHVPPKHESYSGDATLTIHPPQDNSGLQLVGVKH